MSLPVPSHRQEGSAYIVALIVLVVLTIMGLALAMITQTEMQVGANERLATRTFYAAETGLSATLAQALTNNNYGGHIYEISDPVAGGIDIGLKNRITSTGLDIVAEMPCTLCQINNASGYSSKKYVRYLTVINATAERLTSGSTEALAERRVGIMYDLQPIEAANSQKKTAEESQALLGRAEM